MRIESLYQKYKESGLVSTDTRKIVPGAMFFALKGDRFNANTLAHEALEKGASYAVIDEEQWAKNDRYIVVEDSLYTLQQLARYHRNQLRIPFIAITGSNGKTTSKELTAAVLGKRYKVWATKGNLNNHIGVPLTVLAINSTVEIAVVEMGANHVGEIAFLCNIANPTHGAITNIGSAHIGTFGSIRNVIRAKGELYHHLRDHNQAVWVNVQNSTLVELSKELKKPMFYPGKDDYFHCKFIAADPFVRFETTSQSNIQTHLVGEYNFENIALALCIGKFFKVKARDAVQAIEEYVPDNMRSEWIVKGTNTIILDAYNANPTSMQVAIKNLSTMNGNKKVAILGDMYELGSESRKEYLNVIKWLRQYQIDEAYLCGHLFYKHAKPEDRIRIFSSREEMALHLKKKSIQHAVILVKASRGMELENVINWL